VIVTVMSHNSGRMPGVKQADADTLLCMLVLGQRVLGSRFIGEDTILTDGKGQGR